jgi:hypothetical protein
MDGRAAIERKPIQIPDVLLRWATYLGPGGAAWRRFAIIFSSGSRRAYFGRIFEGGGRRLYIFSPGRLLACSIQETTWSSSRSSSS